jgi:predicted O-methyltransferase YrrM
VDGDRLSLIRIDEATYRVGETTFLTNGSLGSSIVDCFTIMKPGTLVERYAEILEQFPGGNIVELGVREGGSTALIALLSLPRTLVALELVEPVPPALEAFVARHDLGATVRPHVGVDQSDRGRLAAIVDAEFGEAALDLVIDDASHLLEPTTASFEELFPRLREGGMYVIEDWAWESQLAGSLSDLLHEADGSGRRAFEEFLAERLAETGASIEDELDKPSRPLLVLLIELMLARARSGDLVAEVVIGPAWVVVVRGPVAVEAAGFRVRDLYDDPFGLVPG